MLNTIGKKAGIDGCASHTMESLNEWLNAFGTPYSAPLLDINHLIPCVRFLKETVLKKNKKYKIMYRKKI